MSDDVVVQLPPPKPSTRTRPAADGVHPVLVHALRPSYWEHNCGGGRFVLREAGVVECAWCGQALQGTFWGLR